MFPSRSSTIVTLFWSRVEKSGNATALWVKRDGTYQPRTWREIASDVIHYAHVLSDAGVEPFHNVVQISENRYEWLVVDLAIQSLGAVHVPVHPTLSGPQMAYQIEHCGAEVVCLSNEEIAAKLAAASESLPRGIRYLSFDEVASEINGSRPPRLGPLAERASDTDIAARHASSPDDLATILYTSGTTGEPKGVMLSQRNLASNTLAVLEAMNHRDTDLRLGFLPLSHIFARTCDVYTWIAVGCQFAQAESRTTVIADCQAIRPTVLNAVPYFFDRVAKAVTDSGSEDPDALRNLLGGRIEYCCSGGAALPTHLYDFFERRGVPILQGYGLTESSPVITVSSQSRNRRGAVGQAIPGIQVRIAEDGEVLTRGPHVMVGYFRDPEATAAAIRDEWLYTGDMGRLDEDGFLYITGRKKELIVTSAGKNIAPTKIESLLGEDPLIHQVMVIGDDRPCLGALIVPDPDALRAAIMQRGIPVASREEALAHPDVRALYAEVLKQRLAELSHHEQVVVFHLLPRAFSPDLDEVTPKLTLRRDVIARNLAAEIEQMYAARTGAACEPTEPAKDHDKAKVKS